MAMNLSNIQTNADRGRDIIEQRNAAAGQETHPHTGHEGMEIEPDPKVGDQTQRDIAEHGLGVDNLGVSAPAVDPAVNKALAEGGLPGAQDPQIDGQQQTAPISPTAYLAAHPAFIEHTPVFSDKQIIHAIEQSHTITEWLKSLDNMLINRVSANKDSAIESNSQTFYFFQRNAIGDALRELWIILQEMEAVLSSGSTLQFLPSALPSMNFVIDYEKMPVTTQASIGALLREIEDVHDGNNALHGAIIASKSWTGRNEALASLIVVGKAINGAILICLPDLSKEEVVNTLFESSY